MRLQRDWEQPGGGVANYARDSLTYKGQYTFREFGLANEVTVADIKWAEDWDRVRNEILTAGR